VKETVRLSEDRRDRPGVVVHDSNLVTWQVETREMWFWGKVSKTCLKSKLGMVHACAPRYLGGVGRRVLAQGQHGQS
jgi:hypothetical protein